MPPMRQRSSRKGRSHSQLPQSPRGHAWLGLLCLVTACGIEPIGLDGPGSTDAKGDASRADGSSSTDGRPPDSPMSAPDSGPEDTDPSPDISPPGPDAPIDAPVADPDGPASVDTSVEPDTALAPDTAPEDAPIEPDAALPDTATPMPDAPPIDTSPPAVCGNSMVEAGEDCDDGNALDWDACPRHCRHAACGDGFVRASLEACDDGNVADGDGCTATCDLPRVAMMKHSDAFGCVLGQDGVPRCFGSLENLRSPPSEPLVDLAYGESPSAKVGPCGLAQDGRVLCWSAYPQAPLGTYSRLFSGPGCLGALGASSEVTWTAHNLIQVPTGSQPASSFGCFVGGFGDHTCAVRPNGELICSGDNGSGQSTPPTGTFSQTCAGDRVSCAIHTDSTLECWGYFPGSPPPAGFKATSVACGLGTICATGQNGGVTCWGSTALSVSTGTFEQASAASSNVCAVDADRRATCWGNSFAELSRGVFTDVSATANVCFLRQDGQAVCISPRVLTDPGPFTKLASSYSFACGILTGGSIRCFGGASTPAPPPGQFVELALGDTHGCAIRQDGTVACWGSNNSGESQPPEGTFRQLATSRDASCAIATDGTLRCWGTAMNGLTTPPAGQFRKVSMHIASACAIAEDGDLTCWGFQPDYEPAPTTGKYQDVSAASRCATLTSGAVTCWAYGRSNPPVQTAPLVKLGPKQCALRSDGRPFCWGDILLDGARPPF
jgi:cysteine-rich repeat protein